LLATGAAGEKKMVADVDAEDDVNVDVDEQDGKDGGEGEESWGWGVPGAWCGRCTNMHHYM